MSSAASEGTTGSTAAAAVTASTAEAATTRSPADPEQTPSSAVRVETACTCGATAGTPSPAAAAATRSLPVERTRSRATASLFAAASVALRRFEHAQGVDARLRCGQIRDPGGSCIGAKELEEDRADALAVVAGGDRDLGLCRPVGIASELRDSGRLRIAFDVRDERMPPEVDRRQPGELGGGGAFADRRDRLDIAVAQRADCHAAQLLDGNCSRMHGFIVRQDRRLRFPRSGHLSLA